MTSTQQRDGKVKGFVYCEGMKGRTKQQFKKPINYSAHTNGSFISVSVNVDVNY